MLKTTTRLVLGITALTVALAIAAADYPATTYDADSPASKKDNFFTQAESNQVLDEIEAIETELGADYRKRGLRSYLRGSSFELWSAGASSAPDFWTLSGTGAAVARQADGQDATYSAQVTAGSAASKLEQTAVGTISATVAARLRSTPFTLVAMVKTSTASACRLELNDGVGSGQSSYHTGGGGWERLSVARTLDASATALVARLLNDKTDSSSTCRFDSAMLLEGKFVQQAFTPFVPTVFGSDASATAVTADLIADPTADNCVKWVAGGKIGDAGAACGSGNGGGSGKPFLQWTPTQAVQPTSSFATLDVRNNHTVLDFDAAADECVYFEGVLPDAYAGGGLILDLYFAATSATSGATGWLGAIERHQDDADDLDSDSFAANQSVSVTTASASGEKKKATITFTDGGQMDSLAAGEAFRARVCRDGDGSVVTDDMAGDAELTNASLREP